MANSPSKFKLFFFCLNSQNFYIKYNRIGFNPPPELSVQFTYSSMESKELRSAGLRINIDDIGIKGVPFLGAKIGALTPNLL